MIIQILKILKEDIVTNTIHVTGFKIDAVYFTNAVMKKLESEGFNNQRHFNKLENSLSFPSGSKINFSEKVGV